jgi:Lipopolysaccharide-assembly, LptC-related
MRPLVLSIGVCTCLLSVAWAQSAGDGTPTQQVPPGQTFKNFEFPFYENGKLKWKASASQAKGITQNRAEAMDVKIKIYDNDTVTTTIFSPQADIFVNEKKMRSSHSVQIERDDMEATAQSCDFDLGNKKYVLRNNVKVTLKNFDPGETRGTASSAPAASAAPAPGNSAPAAPSLVTPRTLLNSDSLPESPGSMSTNSAPIPPTK